ncbi:hypothetical protein I4F81_004637 [Pyropia yezoensis]|uniref:Uncharacterized protein n=1 Tax=Pyropia yezoensis TaxID=2788 RepID=A0ACC3BWJ0_PYRYE|nr:hypothetical protein I4F81_004637 [Neopyropia yezoensis]
MGSSSPLAPASGRNLLVTFDLDGTLLRSASPGGNRAHKLALERSMVAALEGTPHALAAPPSIDAVPHAGSTDPLIVEAVLAAAGVPPAVVAQTLPAILDGATATIDAVMAEEAARAGSGGGGGGVPTVLPGVVDLLVALQSAGVAVGLVTGNLEGIAWAKAAVAAGARGLGVTTGVFGAGTLWAAGATEVLDGLADTRRVLDVLGV